MFSRNEGSRVTRVTRVTDTTKKRINNDTPRHFVLAGISLTRMGLGIYFSHGATQKFGPITVTRRTVLRANGGSAKLPPIRPGRAPGDDIFEGEL